MIILISGASHTGKTNLAQKLLERYKYPYLSIDLLKMGLIRSGNTSLTPYDDKELTEYLWNIVREIIKTAIENEQDLIVEGCYIPFDWKKDLDKKYLSKIKYTCLVFSENYIRAHFDDIVKYANVIEQRLDDNDLTLETTLSENRYYLKNCIEYKLDYILIQDDYTAETHNILK
ncbi:MAG: adenylate kinase [Oscillospiraceae bacterium]|nr:adenylate kinase [Oscillospiraceae bacterium]